MEEADYSAALALFRELAPADPADGRAALGAARACEGLQRWEEAERELRRLIASCPGEQRYFRDLGNMLLRQGKIGEALDSYRQAVDGEAGSNGLCLEIASVLSSEGRPAEALPFCERHVKSNPNDYRSLVLWADCFVRLGSIAAARTGYEAALRIRPDYTPARERLERLARAART
jgi:tetratricopeptide (TPR) repeat protein